MNPHETMKVCPNGHYYQGDHCPYCPTVYNNETKLYPQTGSNNIPICPHCGKPIRKSLPINNGVGGIYGSLGNCHDGIIPWNHEWNGTCEYCGYDYNIHMRQNIGGFELSDKQTSVKVATKSYLYSLTGDQSLILSGVEIESHVGGHTGDKQVQKIFLSTNELKCLLKVLSHSPILQQKDYEHDVII